MILNAKEKELTVSVLTQAKALVEKGWTQKVSARDKWSRRVQPMSDRACKFCMLGALDRAAWDVAESIKDTKNAVGPYKLGYWASEIVTDVLGKNGTNSIVGFNDFQPRIKGRKNVVNMFQKAIAAAVKRY